MSLKFYRPAQPVPEITIEHGVPFVWGDKTKHYNITSTGTYYHENTPDKLVLLMEQLRHNQQRFRMFYGDVITGRSWMDEYDMMGTIGRSMGPVKVPLLIHSNRSMGGGAILDHCIIRIETSVQPFRVLYTLPNYHYLPLHLKPAAVQDHPEYLAAVWQESHEQPGTLENIANFKTYVQARRWATKMHVTFASEEQ